MDRASLLQTEPSSCPTKTVYVLKTQKAKREMHNKLKGTGMPSISTELICPRLFIQQFQHA